MALSSAAAERTDIRFIGDLMGSYVLASRAQSSASVKVFACRARSITGSDAVVHAPVKGQVGEALSISFEALGILRGSIDRHVEGGFAVAFDLDDADRLALCRRLTWLKRRTLREVSDRRAHKRVLPREPRTQLVIGSGNSLPAMIIDMSQSGVAVSADVLPPIGTPVGVGSIAGRVARHLDSGFAVQFAELQQLDQVESQLTLLTVADRRAAASRLGLEDAAAG